MAQPKRERVYYRYRCLFCGRESLRGSRAVYCDRKLQGEKCGGPLHRQRGASNLAGWLPGSGGPVSRADRDAEVQMQMREQGRA
jgi:hypothetical protein